MLEAVARASGMPDPAVAALADSLDAALAELGEVSVAYKLDGAPIQVHRDGQGVWGVDPDLTVITASIPELAAPMRGLPCQGEFLGNWKEPPARHSGHGAAPSSQACHPLTLAGGGLSSHTTSLP